MPRCARRESPSGIYHVVARGSSRQIIFEDDNDRAFFMKRASERALEEGGEIYAWCLMDNHVHLLLRIDRGAMSRLMHALLAGYAGYFNRVHGRTGALFEGRFGSEPVDSEEYLMTVVRYIHRNPLKAGVSDGLSFPWSSYDEYAGGGSGWASKAFVLDVFGGAEGLVRFHRDGGGEDRCLDVPEPARRALTDVEARRVADAALGAGVVDGVKSMPRAARDAALATLKGEGLSVRQIQRLTGVSLGTISRAGK